jgi:hypothetical protein
MKSFYLYTTNNKLYQKLKLHNHFLIYSVNCISKIVFITTFYSKAQTRNYFCGSFVAFGELFMSNYVRQSSPIVFQDSPISFKIRKFSAFDKILQYISNSPLRILTLINVFKLSPTFASFFERSRTLVNNGEFCK